MRLVWHEWKQGRKSLLIWIGVAALLVIIAAAKFAAYYDNPEMLRLMEDIPQGMLQVFGIQQANLTTLEGFFTVMFLYFGVMSGLAAALWSSGALLREEEQRTADFLLALPVARSRLFVAKALAALLNLVLFVLATWLISWLSVQSYHPDQAFARFLAWEMAAMFAVGLLFWAIGLALGAALPPRRAGTVAVFLVLGIYFVHIVAHLHEKLDWLRWLSPFDYFEPHAMYTQQGVDGAYLAISLVVLLLGVVGGEMRYRRRNVAV